MSNETEKLTINLGVVELAQIDVLAEQGIYSNRSDFIRTAIRKQLENYKEKIEQSFSSFPKKDNTIVTIGIMKVSKKMLEKYTKENDKVNIHVIGMLIIASDITPELFINAIENIDIKGKLIASEEIMSVFDNYC